LNYYELLSDYIKKSGLSLSDLAKKITEEEKIKIDKSYISKLKNGNANPPSDELSIALARATGGDPEALVLASYYEKAPTDVKRELGKISLYDKLIAFLAIKKPFDIEFVPSEEEGISEEERKKESSLETDFVNSARFLGSLSDEARTQFIDDLVEIMSRDYPDDYQELHYIVKKQDKLDDGNENRLKELRKQHGIDHIYLANLLDISPSHYLIAETMGENASLNILKVLSKFYNVSLDYISGLDRENAERKNDNNDGISIYNKNLMTKIPLLGSIRAGQPIDRIEYNEGYTLVDPERIRGREAFALRVQGDSMSGDRIQEGDVVIVVKQEEVQPHEIAVVAIDGDYATLKRVKPAGDMCMLIPSNPTMSPELVPCKDVKIIGKVVEVKFSLE